MSKGGKRVVTAVAAILLVFLLAGVILLTLSSTTKTFVEDEYNYSADTSIELENIPVIAQKTEYTCYAVSMAIAKTYLGSPTTEQELIESLDLQSRNTGMVPSEYLPYATQVFEPLSYSVRLKNPGSEAEILNTITESLLNGLPVVLFYSAMDDWNKPNYNTHYAVIYALDMKRKTIKLSNPYGYLEEISFDQLFAGMAYRTYENEPLLHRLGRTVGYIKNNNLIVLEKLGI